MGEKLRSGNPYLTGAGSLVDLAPSACPRPPLTERISREPARSLYAHAYEEMGDALREAVKGMAHIEKVMTKDPVRQMVKTMAQVRKVLARDPMRQMAEKMAQIEKAMAKDPLRQMAENMAQIETVMARDLLRQMAENMAQIETVMARDPMRQLARRAAQLKEATGAEAPACPPRRSSGQARPDDEDAAS